MDRVRKLILAICDERKIPLSTLSRQVGKNHAYMQQFIVRGVPDKLPEDVRLKVAEALGLDETALGAPVKLRTAQKGNGLVDIPEHDVRPQMGHGAIIDSETEKGRWPFPANYVRHTLSISSGDLAIIEVVGDSMEPTLRSGDRVLIDRGDANIAQAGVFALYDGHATVVKRVEKVPASSPPMIELISDNPRHGKYRVHAEDVHIAGRVVWYGRRL